MSGVRAATQPSAEQTQTDLDVPEMVDILYDIVATGVDLGGGVTVEQIETFLHEHARKPHSQEAFQAFFERHGIEARSQTEPRIPLRVLEPVPNAEAPVAPVAEVSSETVEAAMLPPTLPGMRSPAAAAEDLAALKRWSLVAGVAAAMMLGALGWTVHALTGELDSARTEAVFTQHELAERAAEQAKLQATLDHQRLQLDALEAQNRTLLDNLLPSPVMRVDP